MIPIVLSDDFFISITPIYRLNNFTDTKQDRFVQEFAAAYALTEKLQLSGYFSANTKDDMYVYRLGAVFYF